MMPKVILLVSVSFVHVLRPSVPGSGKVEGDDLQWYEYCKDEFFSWNL